jgi:RNA 2',3'-cyclic 3'-phosphodiesterase
MRLFVALDIPQEIRERIAQFQTGLKALAPDVRWVSTESFHVTLKFIGEVAPEQLDGFKKALAEVRSERFDVTFRNYGFFPNPRSARVLWVGIEAPEELAQLASAVDVATQTMGIAREEHAFTPHLTLARSGSGRPQRGRGDAANQRFARVSEHLQQFPAPEFGTMTATEFFLYESKLSPRGAQYTKLARFALEGRRAETELPQG